MSVRRVEKRGDSVVQSTVASKNRVFNAIPEEVFARQLAAQQLVEVAGTLEAESVLQVNSISFDPNASTNDQHRYQRREQLEKADVLLDTLAALGRDLTETVVESGNADLVRERLREARDHALRALSVVPERGEERDLLHRTTVLATVELAKTDRGDYK